MAVQPYFPPLPLTPRRPTTWRVLTIVLTQLTVPGIVTSTGSAAYRDGCLGMAANYRGHLQEMSDGYADCEHTYVANSRPVTTMTVYNGSVPNYYITRNDLVGQYADTDAWTYDHVGHFADRQAFAEGAAGLTSGGQLPGFVVDSIRGSGMAFLAGDAWSAAEQTDSMLMVHEYLHQQLFFYGAASGKPMVNIDNAGSYGYTDIGDSWRLFMSDVLTGRVPGSVPGITPELWRLGAPRSRR